MQPGLVIPSKLQQDETKRAAQIRQLAGIGDPPNGVTLIGNGLGVDKRGNVIVIPEYYGGDSAPKSQMEAEDLVDRIHRELDKRGLARASATPAPQQMRVNRATDPLLSPTPYFTPSDFFTEFGVPVDPTEIIALCEEISAYSALPEVVNGSQIESWRELDELYFTGGADYIAFANGACPEEYTNNTTNRTVTKRHIGAKKTLSQSDIVHSMASVQAGYGVSTLVGPTPWQDVTGSEGPSSFIRANVADAKEKEIRKMMTLTVNAWDELLVKGSNSANPLEFDGIETIVTSANGARSNLESGIPAVYSGTFNVARFDEWLAAGCARPTHVFGHPTAIQALKLAYWSMGAAASAPQVNVGSNGAIVAGATFANVIQTSVGPITLVPDSRFTRTNHSDGTYSANLYALRMTHNGEPLVYRATQIPLNFKDLAPGCSAISFMVWAVTALVVKDMCAHGVYRARFTGLVDDGCVLIHPATNP